GRTTLAPAWGTRAKKWTSEGTSESATPCTTQRWPASGSRKSGPQRPPQTTRGTSHAGPSAGAIRRPSAPASPLATAAQSATELAAPPAAPAAKASESRRAKAFTTPCRPPPSALLRSPRRVDAPDARAGRGEEQETEAVEHGELALVRDRVERVQPVRHPVGDGHLARADEGGPAREETDHHEPAADELDHARGEDHGIEGCVLGRHRDRPAEELLAPVGEEEKPRHDAQQCVGVRAERGHERGHRSSLRRGARLERAGLPRATRRATPRQVVSRRSCAGGCTRSRAASPAAR